MSLPASLLGIIPYVGDNWTDLTGLWRERAWRYWCFLRSLLSQGRHHLPWPVLPSTHHPDHGSPAICLVLVILLFVLTFIPDRTRAPRKPKRGSPPSTINCPRGTTGFSQNLESRPPQC
jgi:hypothetical protein